MECLLLLIYCTSFLKFYILFSINFFSSLDVPRIEIRHLDTAPSCTHEVCLLQKNKKNIFFNDIILKPFSKEQVENFQAK